MRIKVVLTKNNKPLPINNQNLVNSFFHKCLGENNEYHDSVSNYCLSGLRGGRKKPDTNMINYPNGGVIMFTTNDPILIGKFMTGIQSNTDFGYGMSIDSFKFINEEHNDIKGGYNIFRTLTPILIREYTDKDNYTFITINDDDYVEKLNNYQKNKLSKINPKLNLDNFKIIIKPHVQHKEVKVTVKKVTSLATQCDMIIFGDKNVIETLYHYGIGKSTGSGFGTIYNKKNIQLYADCY